MTPKQTAIDLWNIVANGDVDMNKINPMFSVIDKAMIRLEELEKKEVPMKPEATLDIKNRLDFICPRCNRREIVMYDKYCCNCGQKLDFGVMRNE